MFIVRRSLLVTRLPGYMFCSNSVENTSNSNNKIADDTIKQNYDIAHELGKLNSQISESNKKISQMHDKIISLESSNNFMELFIFIFIVILWFRVNDNIDLCRKINYNLEREKNKRNNSTH